MGTAKRRQKSRIQHRIWKKEPETQVFLSFLGTHNSSAGATEQSEPIRKVTCRILSPVAKAAEDAKKAR